MNEGAELFTIKEVSQALGLTTTRVRQLIERFGYKEINGRLYVEREVFDKLKEKREKYLASVENANRKRDAVSLRKRIVEVRRQQKEAYKREQQEFAQKLDANYISVKEITEVLGTSRQRVHQLIRKRNINSLKYRGVSYISRQDFDGIKNREGLDKSESSSYTCKQ